MTASREPRSPQKAAPVSAAVGLAEHDAGILAEMSDSEPARGGKAAGMPGRRRKADSPHELQLPSGRHGLPRNVVVSNQRERIMNALIATIVAYGYGGCSVERVARRAGVSRRTFYEQFSDREDAYLQTYDSAAECLLAATDEAWAEPGDGVSRLRSCLRTILDSIAGEPQLARVCLVDVLSVGPLALEHRERHMRSFAAQLESAAAEHNGTLPPPLATDGLVAAIHDAIYKRVAQERTEELPELLDDLHSFCLMLFQYSSAADPASRR